MGTFSNFARFLFQHLADPKAGAKEIYRILKPGGKLIVHDIGDSIFGLFSPEFPEFTPILKAFGNAQAFRRVIETSNGVWQEI